jgi:tetratricopeptide (TPR) repeat protein/DNA-binding XRE family transcriptional regulator
MGSTLTGMKDQPPFGTLLRDVRLAAGLTQEELSSRSGVSVRSISELERGRTLRPYQRTVRLLADAVGASEPVRAGLLAAARGDRSALAGAFTDPAPAVPVRPVGPVVPRQLPQTVTDFVGRAGEVGRLEAVLDPGPAGTGVQAALVCGQPGSGKTTLALRVAHALSDAFPDGQLWAHLAGASARPRDPGEVLGEWLRALGVHGAAIPAGQDERAALFRSWMAGRRVLLVADDAASSAQVQQLIPGTAGSAVLVTSRRLLAGLPGAELLVLDALPPGEAVGLLARIAGPERVTAEPEAAVELAEACGFLPLALRIAGTRLAARPGWPVSLLAGKMTGERRRLDELEAEDLSVRASVALSYAALSDQASRAFRLLGLLGPVDVAEWVIAALLGQAEAGAVVNELVEKSLLTPLGADAAGQPRYRLHDLLREYARERLADEPAPERDAALLRALRAWLQLADLANRAFPPHPFFPPSEPYQGPLAVAAELAAKLVTDPLAWFTAERLNLIEAVHLAERSGWRSLVIQLAICQDSFLFFQDRIDESVQVWGEIVNSPGRSGDSTAFAQARLRYAGALLGRGEAKGAVELLARCAQSSEHASDQSILAFTLYWQAACAWNMGSYETALRYASEGLALARQIDNPHAEYMNLRQVGQALAYLGREVEGIKACQRAVAVATELGHESYKKTALQTLALSYIKAGEYDKAVPLCTSVLDQNRRLADVREEGVALGLLGDAYNGLGRHQEAAQALAEALPIFRDHANRRFHGLCLLKLGYAYQGMGEYRRAAGYLKDSLPIFGDLHLTYLEQQARETLAACLAAASNGDETSRR